MSAKIQPAVDAVLDHVGLDVDTAIGGLFGAEKGAALGAHRAIAHVGDHPADIVGAHAAKAIAIGVTTGFHDAAALSAAGADVVLPGLLEFPHWLDENVLHARLAVLEERVQAARSLVVAFSGGADSAFLLAASVRALGPDRVLAATAVSPSLPRRELLAARRFAEELGVRHLAPRTDEMSGPATGPTTATVVTSARQSCSTSWGRWPKAGFAVVATGTNADDAAAGFRPGVRAAAERGRSPRCSTPD